MLRGGDALCCTGEEGTGAGGGGGCEGREEEGGVGEPEGGVGREGFVLRHGLVEIVCLLCCC